MSLTKQQFDVTHTIRQFQIPALLDISVTNTPFVKTMKQKALYIFIKTKPA